MSKEKMEYLFCVHGGIATYGKYKKVYKQIQGNDVIMFRNCMGHELPEKFFKKSLTEYEKNQMVKHYKDIDCEDARLRAFKDGDIKEADSEIQKIKSMSVDEYYNKIIEETHRRYEDMGYKW